jgi:hypothetical protein
MPPASTHPARRGGRTVSAPAGGATEETAVPLAPRSNASRRSLQR